MDKKLVSPQSTKEAERRQSLSGALMCYGLNPDRVCEFIKENLEVAHTGLQAQLMTGEKGERYFKQQLSVNEASIMLQILEHEKATFNPE